GALLEIETLVSFASGRGLATLVCEGEPPFVRSAAEALMEEVGALAGVLFARKRGRGAPRRSPAEVVAGDAHLAEELSGGSYRVSPDSFFQSNPAQAARLLQLVREWAEVGRGDVVLDVYTGVGAFLLPLAREARRAIGVESEKASLSDARANVRRWGLRNVALYQGRAQRLLPRLVEKGQTADVVVLDPPRKGCGAIVCASVAKLQPRRIILVSCDPATLARDLKNLAEGGYSVHRVQPVDMFPQTWHVEAVAVCERNNAGEE
ncbi:MAG: 23S rRNA (uracil(1939)-C(5))-methyltransferase RlmD, partial [Armatimonadota bacterium]